MTKTLLLTLLFAGAAHAADPWYPVKCQQLDARNNPVPAIEFRAVVMVHPLPKGFSFTVYTTPDGHSLELSYSGQPLKVTRKEGLSTIWTTKEWDEALVYGGPDNIHEVLVLYSTGNVKMQCFKNRVYP